MRLWSLHPCYLDAKGLVALWREALLARAILKNKTRGYRHHPQLERFKKCGKPLAAINRYLQAIYIEALRRGYNFHARKLGRRQKCAQIALTTGQLAYEWEHLQAKLWRRDRSQYCKNRKIARPRPHPLFKLYAGGIASWEKTV